MAPEATYNLYRIVAADGEFKPSNYLKAVKAAQENRVDIINLSGGASRPTCNGNCRICVAARKVINDGIAIITGSGNVVEDKNCGLFCPAKMTETVGTGVYESYCTHWVDLNPRPGIQSQKIPAPNSYWIDYSMLELDADEDWIPTGQYCSYTSCTPEESCAENQVEILWPGNVDFSSREPDVFAPGKYVQGLNGKAMFDIGTSFSTATVTGAVTDIYSRLHSERPLPTPHDLNRAIESLQTTVGTTSYPKFDSTALIHSL